MWETHRYEIRAGWEEDARIGMLNFENIDGKEIYSFEYEPQWIESHPGLVLDPVLQPYPGRQYAEPGTLFRFLQDASPDRWGRLLSDGGGSRLRLKMVYLAAKADFVPHKSAPMLGDRVGGGHWPADLSHHRTYRSVYGGSLVFTDLFIVAR